jgi:hypothetical protein
MTHIMAHRSAVIVVVALLPLAGLLAAPSAPPPASRPAAATGKIDFVKQVKPLLEAHCAKCHGVRPTKAYSLLTKQQAFTPGESEDAPIVPGKSAQSLIVQLMKSGDKEHRMPQKAPALKPDVIAIIERWINEGAAWPDDVKLTPPPEEKEK